MPDYMAPDPAPLNRKLPAGRDLIGWARAFRVNQELGQHFLINPEVLLAITRALSISPGDTVLEIGSGLGFLTRFLAHAGARVVAVELDKRCLGYLEQLELPDVRAIHADFLDFDLSGVRESRFKVAGNVPYQITGRILGHLLGEIGAPSPWLDNLDLIVLTVQHEVALRLCAKPGDKDYSQVSLLAHYFTEPSIVEVVSADSFYPAPAVTSAVVRLAPLGKPRVECDNPRLLRRVIRAGFGQRRKMLKNNLRSLRLTESELERVFARLGLDPQVRAERVGLETFGRLSDALNSLPEIPR